MKATCPMIDNDILNQKSSTHFITNTLDIIQRETTKQSSILARCKDFLPLIHQANQSLQTQDPTDINIEITDNNHYIQFDLALGVLEKQDDIKFKNDDNKSVTIDDILLDMMKPVELKHESLIEVIKRKRVRPSKKEKLAIKALNSQVAKNENVEYNLIEKKPSKKSLKRLNKDLVVKAMPMPDIQELGKFNELNPTKEDEKRLIQEI